MSIESSGGQAPGESTPKCSTPRDMIRVTTPTMSGVLDEGVTVVKMGTWLVLSLLLFGVTACSDGSATANSLAATDSDLEGVEFIVHQVPG